MKKIITLILLIFIALSLSSCNAIKYHKPINLGKKLDEKNFYFDRNTKDYTDYYNYLKPLGYFHVKSETNDGCYEYYYENDEGVKAEGLIKYGLKEQICISKIKYKNISYKDHYFIKEDYYSKEYPVGVLSLHNKFYNGIVFTGATWYGSYNMEMNEIDYVNNNFAQFYAHPVSIIPGHVNNHIIYPKSVIINDLEWALGSLNYIDTRFEFKYEVYKNYIVLHTNYENDKIVSYYNLKTNCLEYEEYEGFWRESNYKMFIKKSNKLKKLEKENKRLMIKFIFQECILYGGGINSRLLNILIDILFGIDLNEIF